MQTTNEFVEIHLRGIPSDKAELVKEAIEKILDLAGMSLQSKEKDDDRVYSIEEVFPDFHTGHALRGLRSREGLTQKQLAEMIGRPQQYFWVKLPESSSNLMFKKSLEEVSAGVKISFEPIF